AALRQELESARSVSDFGVRLRGDGPDAGTRPRHDRPDGEPVRLNRDTELATLRIPRDDRVGQGGAAYAPSAWIASRFWDRVGSAASPRPGWRAPAKPPRLSPVRGRMRTSGRTASRCGASGAAASSRT